jgi:hypothetical protein
MLSSTSRMLAVILLVIPGGLATYGFILMKRALFVAMGPPTFPWFTFVIGMLLFFGGVAFVGGWIFYRDRKRNYVSPRFREKKQSRKKQP